MSSPEKNITSVLKETRQFPPPKEFAGKANVNAAERDRLAEWARRDPDGFWAEQAKTLHWFKPWDKVLDWSNEPHAKWFVGGRSTPATTVSTGTGDPRNKAAIVREGELGDSRTLTFSNYTAKCKFANGLNRWA